MLECVVNISEGTDSRVIGELADSVSGWLLDIHTDAHHNRSVFTLVGENAPRSLARRAVELLDITSHEGVHPRLGVVDVVPFVPLTGSTMADATRARDSFAQWAWEELSVPSFLYDDAYTLPMVRKNAWNSLTPAMGDPVPHPTAGAMCVGVRDLLVAYNVWLRNTDLTTAQRWASQVRTSGIRTLGLDVGGHRQVSMNLVNPLVTTPEMAYDRVMEVAGADHVARAELVGLVPRRVLDLIPEIRWEELDLEVDRTIEDRLTAIGR